MLCNAHSVYKTVVVLNSGSIHQAKDLFNNANVVQAATDMKHGITWHDANKNSRRNETQLK